MTAPVECYNCEVSEADRPELFTPASAAIGLCKDCREARELDIRDRIRMEDC